MTKKKEIGLWRQNYKYHVCQNVKISISNNPGDELIVIFWNLLDPNEFQESECSFDIWELFSKGVFSLTNDDDSLHTPPNKLTATFHASEIFLCLKILTYW